MSMIVHQRNLSVHHQKITLLGCHENESFKTRNWVEWKQRLVSSVSPKVST
jgi:hypothetical protein